MSLDHTAPQFMEDHSVMLFEGDSLARKTTQPPVFSASDYLTAHDSAKRMFGEKLHRALLAANMSQADLARAAGLTRDNISRYVKGTAFPATHRLAAIAEALNVELDELVPGVGPGAPTRGRPTPGYNMIPAGKGKSHLTVDMVVSARTAVKIVELIVQDEAASD